MIDTPEAYEMSGVVDGIEDIWPPPALRKRIEYLDALHDCYNGDYETEPATRWARRACIQLAEFMTVGENTAGGDDITQLVYSAYVDMLRYGGAVLLAYEDSQEVLDPRWVAPTEDGFFYVAPQLDENGDPTYCVVWEVTEGSTSITEREFDLSRIGAVLDELGSFPSTFAYAYALPYLGEWGSSAVHASEPWQNSAQRRWHGLLGALDKHEVPLVGFRMADKDAEEIFSEEDGDYDTPYDDLTQTGRQKRAAAILDEWPDSEKYALPDAVQGVEVTQFNPHTDQELLTIENMERQFEVTFGIAGLFQGLSEAGMSGIALKRLLAPLYATTLSLRRQLLPAIEELTGQTVELTSPFDVLEEDSNGTAELDPDSAPDDNLLE